MAMLRDSAPTPLASEGGDLVRHRSDSPSSLARRGLGGGVLLTAVALALVPACGFPTLSYDDDGGTSSGGSGGSSGGSSSGMHDAASDGTFTGDGSSGGDGASGDGREDSDASNDSSTPPPDAGGDGSIDCDHDHDGYISNSAQCGGNDCCDTDPNAHPGQTDFFPSADGCMSFDYNCDGTVETEWGAFSCMPGVTGCTPTSGFVGGVPGCGVSEQWTGTCKNMITSCQPGTMTPQTQACH
jgi:hypothetical protein